MDENFFKQWFQGFEQGIDELSQQNKEKLFCKCGKACVDTGVLKMYQDLYKKVNGDRDAFYLSINDFDSVRSEIITPGKVYAIYFPKCVCNLHTVAGVNTPSLCECSRQSIIYVGKSIWKDSDCTVEKIETVLEGAKECKFIVTFL